LRNRERVADRAAASQPASDGLWRYTSEGSRAGHVEPVVVAWQFGQAEESARGYSPAGANGFGQRSGMRR
jgi:hypothetical protein